MTRKIIFGARSFSPTHCPALTVGIITICILPQSIPIQSDPSCVRYTRFSNAHCREGVGHDTPEIKNHHHLLLFTISCLYLNDQGVYHDPLLSLNHCFRVFLSRSVSSSSSSSVTSVSFFVVPSWTRLIRSHQRHNRRFRLTTTTRMHNPRDEFYYVSSQRAILPTKSSEPLCLMM